MKALTAALLLTISTQVHAWCSTEDLTGYWDLYTSAEDNVTACTLRINRLGQASLHRFGCINVADQDTQVTSFTEVSGKFSVDQHCRVQGEITFGNGAKAGALAATLNRDRDLIIGVGADNQLFVGPFQMIKFF